MVLPKSKCIYNVPIHGVAKIYVYLLCANSWSGPNLRVFIMCQFMVWPKSKCIMGQFRVQPKSMCIYYVPIHGVAQIYVYL